MRKLTLLLISLLFTFPALAAPASTESIEKLLAITKIEATMNTLYDSIAPMLRQITKQAAGNKPLTPEQQKAMEAMMAEYVQIMRTELSWSVLKADYIKLYQDVFEQEDVDYMIGFYQSPTGQKAIEKMPLVLSKSMEITQSRMQTIFPKLQAAIEKTLRENRPKN